MVFVSFHKTIQDEFYVRAFKRSYIRNIEELQKDLDLDKEVYDYNNDRIHLEKYCYGKISMQTFKDAKYLAIAKMLDNHNQIAESC